MSKGTRAQAIIVGRMGKDIEVRTTQTGKKIGSLRLAVTDGYGDNENTSWLDVVIFDEKKIEVLEKFTTKGSRVFVSGTLRCREWTDKEGGKRYSTETVVGFDGAIELMDSKGDSPASGAGQSQGSSSNRSSSSSNRAAPTSAFDDLDDDVPF